MDVVVVIVICCCSVQFLIRLCVKFHGQTQGAHVHEGDILNGGFPELHTQTHTSHTQPHKHVPHHTPSLSLSLSIWLWLAAQVTLYPVYPLGCRHSSRHTTSKPRARWPRLLLLPLLLLLNYCVASLARSPTMDDTTNAPRTLRRPRRIRRSRRDDDEATGRRRGGFVGSADLLGVRLRDSGRDGEDGKKQGGQRRRRQRKGGRRTMSRTALRTTQD